MLILQNTLNEVIFYKEKELEMKTIEYTLQNPLGLQAKISCIFTSLANKFESDITIKKINPDSHEVDAKDIIEILSLRICKGDTIQIIAKGGDADASIKELSSYLKNNCL